MTRSECEKKLEEKLREIVDIYHEYKPGGRYLSLTYLDNDGDGYIQANNREWPADPKTGSTAGEDYDRPINFSSYTKNDENGGTDDAS